MSQIAVWGIGTVGLLVGLAVGISWASHRIDELRVELMALVDVCVQETETSCSQEMASAIERAWRVLRE